MVPLMVVVLQLLRWFSAVLVNGVFVCVVLVERRVSTYSTTEEDMVRCVKLEGDIWDKFRMVG